MPGAIVSQTHASFQSIAIQPTFRIATQSESHRDCHGSATTHAPQRGLLRLVLRQDTTRAADSRRGYRFDMRMAPSSRMVIPFRYGFSMIERACVAHARRQGLVGCRRGAQPARRTTRCGRTKAPNSDGSPNRFGHTTSFSSELRTLSDAAAIMGVAVAAPTKRHRSGGGYGEHGVTRGTRIAQAHRRCQEQWCTLGCQPCPSPAPSEASSPAQPPWTPRLHRTTR